MGPRCNPSFKNVYRGKADQVKKWSVKNVSEFLQQIGLKHLVGPFSENEIDGSTFLELTVDDLKEDLGIIDEAAIGIVLTTISEISSHPNKRRR